MIGSPNLLDRPKFLLTHDSIRSSVYSPNCKDKGMPVKTYLFVIGCSVKVYLLVSSKLLNAAGQARGTKGLSKAYLGG